MAHHLMKKFDYREGSLPLIISMPHAGSYIPEDISETMTKSGQASTDTDWYVHRLYEFAKDEGAYWLQATHSRYVIDLNRSADNLTLYQDRDTTELCPLSTFDKEPIYLPEQAPSDTEIGRRLQTYWQPYHVKLQQVVANVRAQYGSVLLFEAHTIASQVPRFFDGQLSDFNFGTNNGLSCDIGLINSIRSLDFDDYTVAIDGVFKGGYITRHYADVAQNIHTLQLELSQAVYLDEESREWSIAKVQQCQPYLENLIKTINHWQKASS